MNDWIGPTVACGILVCMFIVSMLLALKAWNKARDISDREEKLMRTVERLLNRAERVDHRLDRNDKSINDAYEVLEDHGMRLRYLESVGDEEEKS